MNKVYRYLLVFLSAVVGLLCIAAFTGLFYPIAFLDIEFVPLLQRLLVDFSVVAAVLAAGVLIFTLVFGRLYCSLLCPLGLLQELMVSVFRRGKKMRPGKNRPYKYFLAAAAYGMLFGGAAFLIRLLDPYTLFCSAASGAWLGLAVAVLLALLVWFKGRFFCTNICPVGTVLGLCSKYAVNRIYIEEDKCVSCGLCASRCPAGSIDFKNKTADNETCVKCLRCLNACHRQGVHYGRPPQKRLQPAFSPLRRRLLITGGAAALFALAVKSGLEFGKNIAARLKKAVLPAGAGSTEEFADRCLNCNLCVENCPMKILRRADGDFPVVHIDYSDGFCNYDCHKCSEVCPSGAIRKISLAEKQKTQIGLAVVDESLCVKCGLCVMKCPRQIIDKETGGFPQIDAKACIGCGACKNACPVKAIEIVAVDRQKLVK